MEIIESESEGEDDEGDGKGGANEGGNTLEYAVGSAQIVIGKNRIRKKNLVMTRLPMMRSGVMVCKGNLKSGPCHHFLTTAMYEAIANIVLDNEEPEIKTMFKSYKGSHKNVSLMMYLSIFGNDGINSVFYVAASAKAVPSTILQKSVYRRNKSW